jgi:hypothetical protein
LGLTYLFPPARVVRVSPCCIVTDRVWHSAHDVEFAFAGGEQFYRAPFWHDAKKWADYQAANELTLWIDPAKLEVVAMQFSAQGKPDPRLKSPPRTPPAFDDQWMWTDEPGRSQPRPTLFAGLLRANNPYPGQLEGAARGSPAFACQGPNA